MKSIREWELTQGKLIILLTIGILCIFGMTIISIAYYDVITTAKEYIENGTISEDYKSYCEKYQNKEYIGGVRIDETIYYDFNQTFLKQTELELQCFSIGDL